MITIGIDPDCDKSGVAIYDEQGKTMDCLVLSFPMLLDFLQGLPKDKYKCMVVVEGGWLISTNWHLRYTDNARVASAKGNAAGRNHETGRKIVEMLEHYGVANCVVKPLGKRWRGTDGKITHDELVSVLKGMKITFENKRTNQEERDAILLSLCR